MLFLLGMVPKILFWLLSYLLAIHWAAHAPLSRCYPCSGHWHSCESPALAYTGTHEYALHRPREADAAAISACTSHDWFRPFSQRRQYCHCMCLVGACNAFHSSDLVLITCQFFLTVLLGGRLLPGCVHIVVVWLLQMIGARAHDL